MQSQANFLPASGLYVYWLLAISSYLVNRNVGQLTESYLIISAAEIEILN